MLIRQPEYIGSNYSSIKLKIDADYLANQTIWQQWQARSNLMVRLEAGDPSLMTQMGMANANNNGTTFYFNHTRPMGSKVSGQQRVNRKSIVVNPLENGDQETADQWTKIIMGICKRENFDEKLSDAFHQGAFMTGLALLHFYLDFTRDPINGDLKIDVLSFNQFFPDPYFRRKDMSDAKFIWRRSFLSHTEAAMLLPNNYDEIMALPGNPNGSSNDGRFQYMPEAVGSSFQNLLSYDEYYYRSYRKQKLLQDENTGEVFEITNQTDLDIEKMQFDFPQLKLNEQMVPTVRLAIMVQDKVFYDGPNPLLLDCYPFVSVIGFYNDMMPYFYSRLQGMCASLMDPQLLYNRRVNLSADAAESVVNSGWMFKENAPVDVKHFFQTGQGRIIPIKENAQMSDVQQITPPPLPEYLFTLQDTFEKEKYLVTGLSEEAMGQGIDSKSGYHMFLKQRAGLVTLQPLFDRLDASQVQAGNVMMEIIQKNYTPGKIKLLLEGKEPAPLFYNQAFGKYHCSLDQGFNTDTQKMQEFVQLMQLREAGVEIPQKYIIETANIQNKNDILRDMAQQQQQQQQQAMQESQIQMQEQQARTELAYARAQADKGLGAERYSRIDENKALAEERRAEALKDEDQALLNKVKALKEIESLDFSVLERIIRLSQELKAQDSLQHDTFESKRRVV